MNRYIACASTAILNDLRQCSRNTSYEPIPRLSYELSSLYTPQLFVVDGGAPQVNAAQEVLDELGITDVTLCGIAKRLEEVWLPHEEFPVILPRRSEGLYLFQNIRDEAHRVAITYQRSRRTGRLRQSELDNIAGLGEKLRTGNSKRFNQTRKGAPDRSNRAR